MLIGYHTLFLASNDLAIKKVVENNRIIIEIARKHHIDPDLIRSIIMEEMYHSSIIGQHPNLEAFVPELLIKTRGIMQTTINSDKPYHKKVNAQEASNTYQSIDAGAFLLRAEIDRLINQREELNIALIASRYNNHYSSGITQYGRRVENHYINKPWLEDRRGTKHK